MSALLHHVFSRAVTPLVRIWAAGVNAGLAGVPRPTDSPTVYAPGPDSDRVLIVGAGPAVGRGVSSHELALPGALARALANRTGRGAHVHVIADPGLYIRNAGDTLELALLLRYDAIVLILGANDVLAFTSIRMWEKRLARVLNTAIAMAPRTLEMFVVGIQPIRSIPGFDSAMGGLVGRHAELMNRASLAVCSRLSQVTFVPLSAPSKQGGERFRVPVDYTRWGRDLACTIAPTLDAGRL